MRGRPERVLLFRSGRHLQTALDAIERTWPRALVTVVATPAAAPALDAAGIPPERRIIYDRTAFFEPIAFLRSASCWRALRSRPDKVAVLWNSPEGEGHSNVDYTALLLAPVGFSAITPDGSVIQRRWLPVYRSEARRAAVSLAVDALVGVLLSLPAQAIGAFRRDAKRRAASFVVKASVALLLHAPARAARLFRL
jgi:hypothetical protein